MNKEGLIRELVCAHAGQLPEVAQSILETAGNSRLFLFFGDLGAGKTTLIREMLRQLGFADEISSPSFGIVNEYHSMEGRRAAHMDLYRIKNMAELEATGAGEWLVSEDLCLVEWPEVAVEWLETLDRTEVHISQNGMSRVFRILVEHV
jgi:tRNA threonylcarbamoyladenosine biosynthesis protein TsaE